MPGRSACAAERVSDDDAGNRDDDETTIRTSVVVADGDLLEETVELQELVVAGALGELLHGGSSGIEIGLRHGGGG